MTECCNLTSIPTSAAPSDPSVESEPSEDASAGSTGTHGRVLSSVNLDRVEAVDAGRDPAATRRFLGGLGRGLAGILETESTVGARPPTGNGIGLGQLLGGQPAPSVASVQRFVVETALSAVADAFGADGVVMVTGTPHVLAGESPHRALHSHGAIDGDDLSPAIALRLPPSWTVGSSALFALYGTMWEMLGSERHHCSRCGEFSQPVAHRQARVGSHWSWFCRIDDPSVSVVAALVRPTPFDESESESLARSMTAVASAVAPSTIDRSRSSSGGPPTGGRSFIDADVVLSADVSGADPANAITAEVTLRPTGSASGSGRFSVGDGGSGLASVTATGRGPDIETAVATAAANACNPQCRIFFAGSSDLDGHTIAVVIVGDEDGSPRLGVSVRPMGDYAGVAEAVLLAAVSGAPGGIPLNG